jgi:tetratricopeptide (TPR) repeat protein
MNRKREDRKKAPHPIADENVRQPIALWLHGLAAIGDERWEEAILAFQQFLDVSADAQNRAIAYTNLSACYMGLERYDEALAKLAEAERYRIDDPDALHSRGIIYACAGRIQEAIADFEAFSRRWPREARQFETRTALQKLRLIARGKLSPGDYLVDHLQEQIRHNIELGDYHLVERKARRMIEANPARSEGHFALGVACLEQGRYTEARDAFLATFDRDPHHIPTLYDIGYTYLKMDEPEQALPWLERAWAGDRKYLAALHQLGVVCERLGRRDEALTWWRRALQLAPDDYMTQLRLHEIGMGPAPSEPPLPPKSQQMKQMMPLIKARMRRPHVYRNGGLTLTYDQSGFVLEDAENPRNATVYAGGPFRTGDIADKDAGHLLDMIGMIKMVLRLIHAENTRHVAVLAYYQDRPIFAYQAQFEKGERVGFDADGQFIATEVPRFFKLSIDSDLSTPYGDPMQGILIYLNQSQKPGIQITTLTPQGQ